MGPSPICFHVTEFGMHELRLLLPDETVRRCRFMVTSQLGDFAEALDHFYDAIEWMWDGEWTDALEEAVVGLLVALDDHFETLDAQLKCSMMGDTMRSSIESPKKRLEKHLATLMETHDILACGRAEACVRSFLIAQSLLETFGPMMGIGGGQAGVQDTAFYEAIRAFEYARLMASSPAKQAEVKSHIRRLIDTADAHYSELIGSSKSQGLVERWHGGLRESMERMLGDGPEAVIHPLPFQQLRGGGGGYMNDMIASMLGSFNANQGAAVERAETTEAMSSLNPSATFEEAEAKVTRWAESLVNESISFGGPMQPFELHAGEPWVLTVQAVLQSVLSLGFGYVASGGEEKESASLTILMDRVRASLPLHGEAEFLQDRRRRERLKDVCRVVRAARRKGQRLSLSANTDFAGALKALKEHHSESWVGPSLEAVWQTMVPGKRVFAFELWLHDSNAEGSPPRLVAADFGHPHTYGKAYYVATRFFDRELKTLQPGFILAFAEAMCLREAGVELWDLGGADASPMMHYKPQVAIEMGRSEFIRRLRELNEPQAEQGTERRSKPITDPDAAPFAGGDAIPTGVVFADLQEDNLWGSAALRVMEEKSKVAAELAAKEAKKLKSQRPQKVPRAPRQALKESSAKAKPATEVTEAPLDPTAPSQPASASDGDENKAELKRQFMVMFQQFLAEGATQNEAAARALKVVAQ